MGKLTNEFVEECLDRQDGDVPQVILVIAEGADPIDALLERISREEIPDWLQQEFDGLLMHGFEPLLKNDGLERNNAEILLGYLEKTKSETSPGLKFEVEPLADAKELGAEGKYYEEFDVTIRYEGVELGSCVLESEGRYVSGKWVTEPAQWPTLLQGLTPLPTVAVQGPHHQDQEIDQIEELATGLEQRDDTAAIYEAYDELRARQGGLSAVSIGQLAKESGVPLPRLQQFLLAQASQDRVDLHATSLLWHSVSPEHKAGATRVPGWRELAITVTIRQKLVTTAPPTGLDVIKAYDDIVDRPEARKRLEQTNPALVAARDKAVTQLRREKVNQELAQKQELQQTRAVRRRQH
jgi:hypothetical protein